MRGTTADKYRQSDFIRISIHVPREGDDNIAKVKGQDYVISIHVPREGDDPATLFMRMCLSYFNPRPP